MLKRAALAGAGLLMVAGGWVAAGTWRDARVAACEQRSARLAAFDLLDRQPAGFRPVDTFSGCDLDRVVAYAGRQFMTVGGVVDEPAVTAFYRDLLENAGWRIAASTRTPRPDAAVLCAGKETAFGKAHVAVSFPTAGMYAVDFSDSAETEDGCR